MEDESNAWWGPGTPLPKPEIRPWRNQLVALKLVQPHRRLPADMSKWQAHACRSFDGQ